MIKRQLFHVRLSVQMIAVTAMLTALQIILTRFLSITISDYVRIGFGFLPTAITGMILGPIPAMIVGCLGDIIGYLLFPNGPYFIGFTLTAIIGGMIYGICLYQRPMRLRSILFAKLLVDLFLNLGLNTLWINLLYGRAILAILPLRVIKNLVQYPIDVILLFMVSTLVSKIPKSYMPK